MDTNKMLDLKALAEAAGSDEWYAAGDLHYCDDKTGETHGLHHDDGRFIAAASPAAILALLAEIERLKAENEDYKSGQDRYEQIIEDLKAENEALRRDAERYQWLRQGMGKVIVVEPDNAVSCDCDRYEVLLEAEVDDAVDAEIAEEAIHD
ncbi:hypothetical protein QTN23_17720 [Pseudomonas shirazica]|nr:hypothetical protein [Pseudomonas shirazica]MDM9601359.1 hypothetical protein [Pseudomonas shirazica]MDO2414745.1 hypothetical protein [Pseudomonas shirazica]